MTKYGSRLLLVFAAFASLASCTEPKGLLDTWQEDEPEGRELTLRVAGTYLITSRSGEFWSVISGSYSLSPDSIELRPSRRDSRLAPYGSRQSEDLSASPKFRYGLELRGDTLTLRYISAPYDSPEEFTMRFIRGAR